ncbi:hypothetical protein ACVWWI_003361 [Bradyrhizobium sp. USDA 3686]|uniref:hypothetical protein n=1 Tax=Bradyrhizobium TaxID=374 RepID=UPI00195A5B44|nr:hypothetical protein [Bradyrhizobium canariense]MBM7483323.1 hypothetical protein [Bradyrhizobium canariense]UFW75506.1 hypothetical protein BcanWU425_17745 [Bradyrhizobium canariense]
MSDETSSPAGSEPVSIPLAADAPESMSFEDAVRSLRTDREKLSAPAESARPAASEEPATAETELAEEADSAAPPEEEPSEEVEPEAIEPEEEALPTIEAPRSWTKDEKELFKTWPREAQESIARVASTREAEFRRSQNEVATKEKALADRLQAADQAKQQFEASVKDHMQALEREQRREFPDIKTWDDVKVMQATDPLRYQAWDLHQKELALVSKQAAEVKESQEREFTTKWTEHVQKENELAANDIPDLRHPEKGPALIKRAADRLQEIGFKPDELQQLADGRASISIYDHRLQRLIHSDLKLADIERAKTAAVRKPVPQVQRPGAARPATAGSVQQIQALERQLATATGSQAIKLSAQIHALERKAVRR